MGLRIEFVETASGWRRAGPVRRLAREAIAAAAEEAGVRLSGGAEMTVHLVDDARIHELNKQWRAKDAPTNVLSFPAAAPGGVSEARLLGDVFVALETVRREAEAEGKSLADHFRHLVAHGFLHLIGFDHETGEEAEAMERIEIRALARLGVADPYAGAEIAS
jgi:probable rRNA maturation factor